MKYAVKLHPAVKKQLKRIDKKQAERIVSRIDDLSDNPYPTACEALIGREGYRIRVGDYRVIYEVKDKILLVHVIRVGHRKDIYKK
jgi:mRNA interferase RelE/StbE